MIKYHIKTIAPYNKVTFLSNPSFDVSFQEIFSTLLCGAILYPIADIIKKNIHELTHFITKNKLDSLFFPTAYFKVLIEDELFLECLKENVRHIIVAGEKLILNDLIYKKIREAPIKIHNHYGPAETHVVTTYTIDENSEKRTIPPIGKPIANTSVYILNSHKVLCTTGEFGKLYLAGKGLAKGYLNKNELTAEKFINNPFVPGTLMYDTGDIASWLPDGNIEFLGRKDFQVKVRGYRIETNEVETILSSNESLNHVIVDVKEMNGDNALIAYYVKKDPSKELEKTELRNYMKTKVPEYMVPTFFVEIDSLPLTPNGKVDRNALPGVTSEDLIRKEYIAAKTENEKKLVKIWEDILGVEEVGMTDNFFELGGNSLKLIVLSNTYKKDFKLNIKINELFKNADISAHLQYIRNNNETGFEIRKAEEYQYYPITPTQKGIWEIDRYLNSKVFQLSFYEELNINIEFFKEAYEFVIHEYEIFKMIFNEDTNGEIKQGLLYEKAPKILDLDYRDKEDPYASIKEYIEKDQKKGFDLSEGPLYKCILFKIKDNRNIIYFNIHHIICDGVSLNILRQKLFDSYKILERGEKLIPENMEWQFKDYVTVMYENNVPALHQNYWKEKFLNTEIPQLELRFAKKRPAVKTFNGSSISNTLDTDLYEKLLNIAGKTVSTLYTNLLAVIYIALYKNASQKEIIIGCPISGRESVDMDNQVGCFVSTIPLKTNIEDHFTYQDLLDKIKSNVFESFEYSFFSLENLKKDLQYETNPSRSPFFDVAVVLLEDIEKNQTLVYNQNIESAAYVSIQTKYDLSFNFVQNGKGLKWTLDYNTDIFERSSMELFFNDIISLMKNIEIGEMTVSDYVRSITDKDELAEYDQFLEDLNDTIDMDF